MFKELFIESKEDTKSLKEIEKMLKSTTNGDTVQIRVKDNKARNGINYVTLLDIQKDKLLTTGLPNSNKKTGIYDIDDVITAFILRASIR
jgi:hypothetical protein